MNVFLDTSVVLRRLLHEPNAVPRWGKWDRGFASRLWLVEAFRTTDRLRLDNRLAESDVPLLRRELRLVDETLAIVPVDESILERASEPFPTRLGTLDAIHLASALAVQKRVPLDCFLTHDRQLAQAAASMGFAVDGT